MFILKKKNNSGNILEQEQFNEVYTEEKIKKEYRTLAKYPEYLLNEDYYYAYLSIIERCKKLFNELGVNTSTFTCFIFEYLLKNGYLSKDKKLEYSVDGRINNIYLYGADVVRGKSVCLNNTCMFSDVLNSLGYKTYPVFGKTPSSNKQSQDKEKLEINHMINVIKDNNDYYLADVTYGDLLKFNGFMQAEYIINHKTIKVKPEYSLHLGYMKPEEFSDIVNNCYKEKDNIKLNRHDTLKIKKSALRLCRQNVKLLNDFYQENIGDINLICEKLVSDVVLEKKYKVN